MSSRKIFIGEESAISQSLVRTITSATSSVSMGQAVVSDGYHVKLANTANLSSVLTHAGIATSTGSAGGEISIIHHGLVDPDIFNLGDGYACAVGTNSNGVPVRVTDPTCVSGLKYVGVCDANGAIYVSARQESVYRAEDFGFVSGGPANDALARVLIECMRSRVTGGTISFGPGDWHFAQAFGPIPGGVSVRGSGLPARYSPNMGTRLIFDGPGSGILFSTAGTQSNSNHGGTVEALAIGGNLNTGHTAPLVNTPFNTRTWLGQVSPIPTLTGTPSTAHVWEIVIQSPTTFQWASDGGTYTTGVSIAPTVLLADGVSINFPAGTYVTGDSFTAQTVQNINECGIEVIGDVNVTIQSCATNGFKYQISADGAEGFNVRDHGFQSVGADLNGYSDMTATGMTDANVACGMRVGSFKFIVDGSANGVYGSNLVFNNSFIGVWHQDGQNNSFRDCISECNGSYVWFQGGKNIILDNFQGEGNSQAALYFHSNDLGAGVFGVTLRQVSAANACIFLDIPCNGMTIDTCELLQKPIGSTYAIVGANNIQGLFITPNCRTNDYTKIADTYSAPLAVGMNGLGINNAKAPAAAIDAKLADYNVPAFIHRIDDMIASQLGGPTSEYDGTIESFDQCLSGDTALVGARAAHSVSRIALAMSASATDVGALSIIDAGSSTVIMTVQATRADDSTKSAYWQIRQQVHREGATLALLGSPTTLDSEDLDGSFVAPTITADASGSRMRATLTGHPSAGTVWAVFFGALETGR